MRDITDLLIAHLHNRGDFYEYGTRTRRRVVSVTGQKAEYRLAQITGQRGDASSSRAFPFTVRLLTVRMRCTRCVTLHSHCTTTAQCAHRCIILRAQLLHANVHTMWLSLFLDYLKVKMDDKLDYLV